MTRDFRKEPDAMSRAEGLDGFKSEEDELPEWLLTLLGKGCRAIDMSAKREVISLARGEMAPPGYEAYGHEGGPDAAVGPWKYMINGHEVDQARFEEAQEALRRCEQ